MDLVQALQKMYAKKLLRNQSRTGPGHSSKKFARKICRDRQIKSNLPYSITVDFLAVHLLMILLDTVMTLRQLEI